MRSKTHLCVTRHGPGRSRTRCGADSSHKWLMHGGCKPYTAGPGPFVRSGSACKRTFAFCVCVSSLVCYDTRVTGPAFSCCKIKDSWCLGGLPIFKDSAHNLTRGFPIAFDCANLHTPADRQPRGSSIQSLHNQLTLYGSRQSSVAFAASSSVDPRVSRDSRHDAKGMSFGANGATDPLQVAITHRNNVTQPN